LSCDHLLNEKTKNKTHTQKSEWERTNSIAVPLAFL
jgi:hypothetical protein